MAPQCLIQQCVMKAKGGLKVLDQAVEMVQVLTMFSALDELLCNSINSDAERSLHHAFSSAVALFLYIMPWFLEVTSSLYTGNY